MLLYVMEMSLTLGHGFRYASTDISYSSTFSFKEALAGLIFKVGDSLLLGMIRLDLSIP
jgi:hypothetical protein